MRLVFSRKMKRENRVTKGFDQKTNVNVLLLYWPINNLGKHLPDKQYPKKVALLNTLRAGKATCIVKGSRYGPEIRAAYIVIPTKYGIRNMLVRYCRRAL